MDSDKTKHLEFIQATVVRMNSNSFMIKGWMITLVSALFALAAKDADTRFVMVTYVAIPAFWVLDGFYVSQERRYRALYDAVRESASTTFSMDTTPFDNGRNTWMAAIFSTTLLIVYLLVVVMTWIVMFWLSRGGK